MNNLFHGFVVSFFKFYITDLLFKLDLELPRLPYDPSDSLPIAPRPIEVKPDSSSVDPRTPMVEMVRVVGVPDDDEDEEEENSTSDTDKSLDVDKAEKKTSFEDKANSSIDSGEVSQEFKDNVTPAKRPDKLVKGKFFYKRNWFSTSTAVKYLFM